MMELKNLGPKTDEDFIIAMLTDSCEEVFYEQDIAENEENRLQQV